MKRNFPQRSPWYRETEPGSNADGWEDQSAPGAKPNPPGFGAKLRGEPALTGYICALPSYVEKSLTLMLLIIDTVL